MSWECLGVSSPVLLVTLPIKLYFLISVSFLRLAFQGTNQKCSNRYDGVQCEVTQSCITSAITTNRIYKENVVAFWKSRKLICFHNISAQQNVMAIFVWTCCGAVGMCSAANSFDWSNDSIRWIIGKHRVYWLFLFVYRKACWFQKRFVAFCRNVSVVRPNQASHFNRIGDTHTRMTLIPNVLAHPGCSVVKSTCLWMGQ